MKPYEVGMFKLFLFRRGLDELYIGCYRSRRWEGNPKSIEKFFYTVDAKDVVMKAFYFLTNTNCGYDFWSDIDKNWQKYRVNQWDEEHAKHWMRLRGEKRRMLTQDWDVNEFWKHQNRTSMLEKILGLLGHVDDKGSGSKVAKVVETNVTTTEVEKETEEEVVEDTFEEVVVVRQARESRMKANEISINLRSNKGRLTINQETSKKMRDLGGYRYVSLLRNNNGDVVIKFNNDAGSNVTNGTIVKRSNANVTINATSFVNKIAELISMKEDYKIYEVKEITICANSYSLQIIYK